MFTYCIAGTPSKPKGPLDVTDVTANGCHLKWKEPEDDGGEPIDYYQVSGKISMAGKLMWGK